LSGATVLFLSTILAKELLYNGNVRAGLGSKSTVRVRMMDGVIVKYCIVEIDKKYI